MTCGFESINPRPCLPGWTTELEEEEVVPGWTTEEEVPG